MTTNVHRGRIVALSILSLEVIFAAIDIITSVLKVDNEFHFGAYLVMYLLIDFD